MRYRIFSVVTLLISIGLLGAVRSDFFEIRRSQQPAAIQLKSSVLHPVVKVNGDQRVFLIVRDQEDHPIQGAASLLNVIFSDESQTWLLPLTDLYGVTYLDLSLSNQSAGSQVFLEFQVIYNELEAVTRDSFRIWW
jgi:hypothetical protein